MDKEPLEKRIAKVFDSVIRDCKQLREEKAGEQLTGSIAAAAELMVREIKDLVMKEVQGD